MLNGDLWTGLLVYVTVTCVARNSVTLEQETNVLRIFRISAFACRDLSSTWMFNGLILAL